jgi:5-methylthioadenosine/S-adenosylhomocysteine deaminase
MQSVDLIIKARWIIPVIPENTILDEHALAIIGDKIVGLCTWEQVDQLYSADSVIELTDHALIPGLINAHSHAAMTLLRGYADDQSLEVWLNDHIWPAEGKWVSEQFVRDGTDIAMAEMIRSGTTCFADMYFFPEVACDAVTKAGMRAQITFPILDFPTAWGSGPDEYFSKGQQLLKDQHDNPRITVGFGPHAPYTVSDEPFKKIVELANIYNAPIQIHLHETAGEISNEIDNNKPRPSERLQNLGVLTPRTQCVHMTQVNDIDISILQTTGAHVVHCPESNLKLASGLCPVQSLLDNNINVALGTDGAASNNDLNMFGEMRTAALLAKSVSGNPGALNAHQALKMATSEQTSGLTRTHQSHLSSMDSGIPVDMKYIVPFQSGTGDGNTVDLPSQQVAFSQNAMEYQMSLRFLDGKIKGLLSALKGE